KFFEVENDNLKICALTDNQNKAILLDNNIYLPKYEYGDRYSDVYLMDLNTGRKERILEKQLRVNGHLVASQEGKQIAYFKDNHWWSYDIHFKVHHCLTENVSSKFNK